MTDTAPGPATNTDLAVDAPKVSGPPPGLTQAWRAPLTAYAMTLGASLVLAALTIVALGSSGSESEVGDASEAAEGVFAFVALPFQLTALALAGRIGFGDDDLSFSVLGLPLLLTAIYVGVVLRVASRAERRTPASTRGQRAQTSGVAALGATLAVCVLTRVFALRADGESFHALSVSLMLGTLVFTFCADFIGRELATNGMPATIRRWVPPITVWLSHLALWLVVAFPVLFVLTWVNEGFRAALSLPLWWLTGGIWTYALGHLSSVGALGFNTYAWTDTGVLTPLALIGAAVIAALVASVVWHLRGARTTSELAQPGSWVQLPATFAAGGLLITLLSAVSVGGDVFGVSGSVSIGPAGWTFILLGLWGLAIEALSRTVAPRLAVALPASLATRVRGTAEPREETGEAPVPLTPEQSRKVRRIALIGGGAAVVVIGGLVAVSVVNSMLYSPEKVAQRYLDAVADGDVEAALDVAEAPEGTSDLLLTDEVYAAATDRPTSYSIEESTAFDDTVVIRVEAEGGVGGAGLLTLEKDGKKFGIFDQWTVTEGLAGTVSLYGEGSEAVSINGVEVDPAEDPDAEYAAFPGTYTFDQFAASEWFDAEPTTIEVTPGGFGFAEPAEPRPSAAFEAEVDSALDEWLDGCMASTDLEPEGCPQYVFAFGDVRNLSWELTTPPTVDYSFFDATFPITLSATDGVATATYEADDSYGYGPRNWTKETEESSINAYFSVDVVGDALTVSFDD